MRLIPALVFVVIAAAACSGHTAPPSNPRASATGARNPAAPSPSTVTGRVLRSGVGIAGLTVQVIASANSTVMATGKIGDVVPQADLGDGTTTGDGRFSIALNRDEFTSRFIEGGADGSAINVEVDVLSDSGLVTLWHLPLELSPAKQTAPVEIEFDIGKHTVTLDGDTSALALPS